MRFLILFLMLPAAVFSQTADLAAARLRADTKFLASDGLEGRGVGTRGGLLATDYIATQFASMGLTAAGDHGTYFQKVPMVSVRVQPESEFTFASKNGTVALKYYDDYVGANQRQRPVEDIDAELVFVGFGISAPQYNWDDYKGLDARGKILVYFTNEPESKDLAFFQGGNLTNFGRWTYKYDEARRHGALGAIIIHTTPTATYDWTVVKTTYGNVQHFFPAQAGEHNLAFAGWVTTEYGEKILSPSGHNVEELLKASNSREFRPIPLGVRLKARLKSEVRQLDVSNVVATIPGTDAKLKSEAVLFIGHWDGLGVGREVAGDAIYNGAIDNATGCAMLLEVARKLSAAEQKPRRTLVFLATGRGGIESAGCKALYGPPVIPRGQNGGGDQFRELSAGWAGEGPGARWRRPHDAMAAVQ